MIRPPDYDDDGIENPDDNCVTVANPGQEDSDGDGIGNASEGPFEWVRGDTNRDGRIDISDPISILGFLFGSYVTPCQAAGDANDDNRLDIADPIFLVLYFFSGGQPPRAPFPEPGPDPTPGGNLTCEQ